MVGGIVAQDVKKSVRPRVARDGKIEPSVSEVVYAVARDDQTNWRICSVARRQLFRAIIRYDYYFCNNYMYYSVNEKNRQINRSSTTDANNSEILNFHLNT